jgi:nicotinate phosphoribosyltransferase
MIIESIIDTDLYKLTMQKAVCSKYPSAYVSYLFHNRGGTKFPDGFDVELRKEITNMSLLSLTVKEKAFLKEKCPYLGDFYLDFLQGYRFKPEEVGVTQINGDLTISISGLWYRTILWEVPLMAIISELYF